ncbi:hypothetical protein ACFX11_006838 [Malus domestica]
MVTASQLQILQSPITSLISTVSTSVTVKLDETNYLVWHFQMQLLLEGHGILGFVDGSTPCPIRFTRPTSSGSEEDFQGTLSHTESDDYKIWKMHDRALMQLITATLSPSAISCVIGSISAQDIWTRLKEQFSTVTRTNIFQMKSELQNVKKGNDSISLYLQRIKEVRDYLSAAGVKFDDDDIVILTLNGLSSEYNTIRSIIRGREHVISIKDLRSQLLAEEAMIESVSATPFLTAMTAENSSSQARFNGKFGQHSSSNNQSAEGSNGNQYGSQYKSFYNKTKGKGKFQYGSKFGNTKPFYPNSARGILGNSPNQGASGHYCQICGKYGHLADTCRFRNTDCAIDEWCQICGRKNHSAQFCHFRNANTNSPSGSMNAMHDNASAPPMDSNFSQQVWLTDSGATNHMTADLKNLSLATPFPSTEMIQTASGEGLQVFHKGSSILQTPFHNLKLNSVLYVPRISQNLLSVHKICLDNNCWLIFDAWCFWIQDKATGRILFKGLCNDGLYPIPFTSSASHTPKAFSAAAYIGKPVTSSLWHHRLGHPSNKVVSLMLKKSNVSSISDSIPVMCSSCIQGKISKLPFDSVTSKSVQPFDIVHSDVWGPAPCLSIEGFKYYVTFIDQCTRFCWIFPLVNKADVCPTFLTFYQFVLTHFSVSIKTLQSDGGGEYIGHQLQTFLAAKGISHHLSCPYTPEQNGLAERKHRHIIETTITLLQTSHLPAPFWSCASQTSVYLINRMPSQTLNQKSPFEMLYGSVPDVSHLKVFGCSCYPLLRPLTTTKLQPRTIKCIFLGYASKYKGYICYAANKKKVYISRHVLFDESEFPYSGFASTHAPCLHTSQVFQPSIQPSVPNLHNVLVSPPITPSPLSSDSSTHPSIHQSINASDQSFSPHVPVAHAVPIENSVASEFQPESIQAVLFVPPFNLHPMQTRSKNGIFKKKAFLTIVQDNGNVDLSLIEPATYKLALKCKVWVDAMKEELDALHTQSTWSLVPLPAQKNLVGCKWVFKIKRNADGSIGRYKARLVAKGFNQEEGIDYGETFSPVVKPTTVRLVLAMTAHFAWPLRQLDVKNAFLHGVLQEEVYMSQPPGFGDPHHSDFVCKLHKSLYGLKQAPRAWNDRFTSFLPSLGFTTTPAAPSLFVKHFGSNVVILLLYVDDIILTGNDPSLINDVIVALTKEFDIKDLGPLHFFLGIQVLSQTDGLVLSQTKYVKDLLIKTEMLDSKPCSTPCLPYNRLVLDDGKPYNNPALYRSVVGALQYLTFTRPDIAFAVHQVYQFMQTPMESHFSAVKRILRYLKGTVSLGIRYIRGGLEVNSDTVRAFSNADWAGDPNDRRSTTGFVVFLGSNPISWSSKKQQTVSRSSTEAEYRALAATAAELDWIKQLLTFVHLTIPTSPVLYCDNMSAIALTSNPVLHQRTKHIEVDIHFVRERVAKKQLLVQFVSSNEQYADILTKGLSTPLFHTHCRNLSLDSTSPELEGGC